MRKILLLFAVWVGMIWQVSIAQEANTIPFGNVSLEEIETESYEALGDSPIIMLLNYRAVRFPQATNRPVIEYYNLKRFKILEKEGAKLAEQEVIVETDKESLVAIRAATYRSNPAGEVVTYKVRKNRIKKEKIGKNRFKYTFSLPVLRVGSVFEVLVHTRRKEYKIIPEWSFQTDYPVLKAEHHALIPDAFDYTRVLKGDVTDIGRVVVPYRVTRPSFITQPNNDARGMVQQNSRRNIMTLSGEREILVLYKLPPIQEEAFSPLNPSYVPKIGYHLKRDFLFGGSGQRMYSSWDAFHKYVSKKYSAKKLKADPADWQRSMSKKLRRKAKGDKREFLEELVAFVQRNIRWDSTLSTKSRRLKEVWQKGEGNGAEINLIAHQLLQQSGFDTYPIFISTVDNGEVQPNMVYMDQFNHIILGVEVGEDLLLVDLVNGQESLELLPDRDLNQLGLMIGDEGYRWLPLRLQNPSIRYTYSRFRLDDSGKLTGQIEELHRKQSLAEVEKQLEELGKDPNAYWKDVQFSGLESTSFTSAKQAKTDVPETLKLIAEVSTNDFSELSSDVMIIQPMLIRQLKQNPFSQERRATPVDLTHPIREAHLLGLEIPEGFEVVQAPEPIRVMLPNGGGTFIYNFTQMDNILHVSSSIFLDQTLFLPQEYPVLQEFFKLVVSKHEEDIILARKK